jgi:hypothetical protein
MRFTGDKKMTRRYGNARATCSQRFSSRTVTALATTLASLTAATAGRGDVGSLLIFADVEIKWDSSGNVTRNTIINLSNGYREEVRVQLFFVNGDPPLSPALNERAHRGCNHSGCRIRLSRYQATYWSALTGIPGACPFGVLDPGPPPGRPDPEHPGGRMLRGFIFAFAVDNAGQEMNWNYLHGDAMIFDFNDDGVWGYEAEGFRALAGAHGQTLPTPGELHLDGIEYETAFSRLLLNFTAAGDVPLFGDDRLTRVDTALTLLPLSQDSRQDHEGPITTKAKFDITNMDEINFSGTTRCITCWDQTLLTAYDPPNHFLLENLHTEVGQTTIDGIASPAVCGDDSVAAALVGVAVRIVSFPATAHTADWTGDGVVNVADHAGFAECMSESGPAGAALHSGCETVFDFEDDGDVDLRDFALLPFAVDVRRSYSAVPLVGEGSQAAVIHFDVP